MSKYPFVKQTGLRDCGPACILMILKYYGGYMNLNKLNILMCTSNKGTSIYNMIECLKYLGFNSNAYKYDDISFIKCPSIAHVKYDNYNHYIVIYKINYKKKYLIIGDPNKKIIKTSFKDFLSIWSNIVIEMKPVFLIAKEKEPKIINFILKILKSNINYLIFIGFISIIICFLSIFSTFFLQIVISNKNNCLILITSFFLTLFLKSLLEYIRNIQLFKMNYKIDNYLSFDTFKKIINLPYASSKNKTSGELISYYNDLFVIKNSVSYLCIVIFVDIPLMSLLSVILISLCHNLYIINTSLLLICLLINYLIHKKQYYISDEVLKNKALLNSYINENITGFETINNLNIKDKVISNYNKKYNSFIKLNKRLDKIKNKESLFKNIIFNTSLVLILIYGFNNNSNIITIYFLFSLLNTSFIELLNFDQNISNVIFSIKHIQELEYETKKEISISGNIYIKHVSKKFNGKLALDDINLSIKKGEKICVSGESGSGKSTLFKIIKGYYTYEGKCQIDGYESSNYHFKNILYISQNEYLFTGRVIDNFLRGSNKINEKICEIDKIEDDIILENGFNLSNGQKQRIALARALNDFNIIIIDEGLDGVDINMERRILKKIFKYYRGKTIIYISHRLDNLDLFDRFIKMESGRIILDEAKNNQKGVKNET